jgi:hypothetical protein
MRESTHALEEIIIEVGVSPHPRAGAIIAETSGEAKIKISLTWRHAPGPP